MDDTLGSGSLGSGRLGPTKTIEMGSLSSTTTADGQLRQQRSLTVSATADTTVATDIDRIHPFNGTIDVSTEIANTLERNRSITGSVVGDTSSTTSLERARTLSGHYSAETSAESVLYFRAIESPTLLETTTIDLLEHTLADETVTLEGVGIGELRENATASEQPATVLVDTPLELTDLGLTTETLDITRSRPTIATIEFARAIDRPEIIARSRIIDITDRASATERPTLQPTHAFRTADRTTATESASVSEPRSVRLDPERAVALEAPTVDRERSMTLVGAFTTALETPSTTTPLRFVVRDNASGIDRLVSLNEALKQYKRLSTEQQRRMSVASRATSTVDVTNSERDVEII